MTGRALRIAAWVVVLAALAVVPFASGKFVTYLATRVLLLGIFAIGYDLLLGQTGLLSFGARFFPTFDMFLTFILMAAVLLWRPRGLFGATR